MAPQLDKQYIFSATPIPGARKLNVWEAEGYLKHKTGWHHVHVSDDGKVSAYDYTGYHMENVYIWEKSSLL